MDVHTTPQQVTPRNLPAPPDAALVAAALDGDREAYGLLVRRHHAMVAALSRRMLDDPALAEDAVSEAVVAGLGDLGRLRDPERFGPWLAGIALNVCRRWLRERARHAPVPDGREPPLSTCEGPETAAELRELAARVRGAVAALPPGQREAVAGFYLQGLGHRELAAELGIGVGAVKTRLHKARVALRRRLWDLHDLPDLHDERKERPMTAAPGPGPLVPMRVADVHRLPPNADGLEPHVVVLEEVGADRRLPIWIGAAEAAALAFTLASVELPRPPTYRFAAGLVAAAGGTVRSARITRLTAGVFYAEVRVEGAAGAVVVDARPSDALNLALVLGVPVEVDVTVLHDVERGDREHQLPPDLLRGAEETRGADAIVARWAEPWPGARTRAGD